MQAEPSLPMGTLAVEAEIEDRDRPSAVKVVRDRAGRALYFSRSCIPYARRDGAPRGASAGADPGDVEPAREERPLAPVLRHVGIYAYRRDAVLAFARMQPTALERTEKLEQLRALENGWDIRVVLAEQAPRGIDTPEDYEAFCRRVHAAHPETETHSVTPDHGAAPSPDRENR